MTRRTRALAVLLVAVIVAGACSDDADSTGTAPTTTAASPTRTTVDCDIETVAKDRLTFATDASFDQPWFEDEPSGGKGFESEVAYELAGVLGYDPSTVSWVTVERADLPSAREDGVFDIAIDHYAESSLPAGTPHSDPYFTSGLALVGPEDSRLLNATLEELAGLRLGLVAPEVEPDDLREVLGAGTAPVRLEDVDAAGRALLTGSVDGVLFELGGGVAAVNSGALPGELLVGRLPAPAIRYVVILRDDDSVACVNHALVSMREDGALDRLTQAYLSDLEAVPVLRET